MFEKLIRVQFMNKMIRKINFRNILLIIAAMVFLWISSVGLLYHMSDMRTERSENHCLFGSSNKVCDMNFSEHVNIWQGIILSLPQNITGAMGLLLLLITLALVSFFWRNSLYLFSQRLNYSRLRLYIKQHPQINLFNYLKEIFSNGILNTKKYKLAII